MALETTTVAQRYTANGVLTAFAITPAIIESDSDEIKVFTRDESGADPVIVEKVEGVDYTLTGATGPNAFNTTVTFNSAPANGLIIQIERELDLEQEYDPEINSGVNLPDIETALDRAVAMIQQLNFKLRRALTFSRTSNQTDFEIADPDGNGLKVLVLNEDEDGFEYGLTLTTIEAAEGYAIAAAASQAAAASSASSASTSASSASTSASAASTSASGASTSASAASASASAASSSQTAAASSASAASSSQTAAASSASAASSSETAAASSASAASTSASAASTSASGASTSATAASGSATAASASASAAAASAAAAAISASSALWLMTGTRAAPTNVTTSGITLTASTYREAIHVQGSPGAVTIPDIPDGTTLGQEIRLIGMDDTKTVTIAQSAKMYQNGNMTLSLGNMIEYQWTGVWQETRRVER